MSEPAPHPPVRNARSADFWIVWAAQGFGSGRLRPGPGTWGSAAGLILAWPFLFLPAGVQAAVLVFATAAAVWICGEAERILGAHDPGSVVLDEIVAVLWALSALNWIQPFVAAANPQGGLAFAGLPISAVVVAWVGFRVADIAKPWPVSVSQKLPGGWGVVVDDLFAAAYAVILAAAGQYFLR